MAKRYFYWCPNKHNGNSKRVYHTGKRINTPYYCPVCKTYFSHKQMRLINNVIGKHRR